MKWPGQLSALQQGGAPFVIVTVGNTRGSTPRETGAKMFVTRDTIIGTIGGGKLEHDCTAIAAQWLREPRDPQTFTRTFTLGADCGQCCGGVAEIVFEQILPAQAGWIDELVSLHASGESALLVTVGDSRTGVIKRVITADGGGDAVADRAVELLRSQAPPLRGDVAQPGNLQVPVLFEPLQPGHFEIVLFGAGHVGSALIASLANLDCRVVWVDDRENIFPADLPGNVAAVGKGRPQELVDEISAGAYCVVMTHSHALDLEIVARALQRDDLAFCGLIGSRSKRRQFDKRLGKLGLTDSMLRRLTCPIGITGIRGKRPAEIAIAVTAQLLQLREAEIAARAQPLDYGNRQSGL